MNIKYIDISFVHSDISIRDVMKIFIVRALHAGRAFCANMLMLLYTNLWTKKNFFT